MTQLITAAELGRFAPNAPASLREPLAQALSVEMPKWGIDRPLIILHFLAHLAHESGEWTIKRENMRYTAARIMAIFGVGKHSARITWDEAKKLAGNARALANRVYGTGNPKKAKELGNTGPNDGYDFRGGGDIQSTGRGTYAWLAKKTGLPLTQNSDLIGEMPHRVRCACAEWTRLSRSGKSASEWALQDNLRMSTYAVNGGQNGINDRTEKLARAKKIWPADVLAARLKGVTAEPTNPEPEEIPVPKSKPVIVPEAPTAPEVDPLVYEIQSKLTQLGYRPGLIDGIPGTETRNAIMAFEADNDMPITGKPSKDLLEPLVRAGMKPLSETRENATLEDLKDSRIVKHAEKVSWKAKLMKMLGLGGLAAPGLAGGVDEAVDLDRFTSITTQLKGLVASIGPYWWVFAIAAGIGITLYFRSVEKDAEEVARARLDDHRMGKTL
jgi:predicted chitinase